MARRASSLWQFLRELVTPSRRKPAARRLPALQFEHELRRGMRGDAGG